MRAGLRNNEFCLRGLTYREIKNKKKHTAGNIDENYFLQLVDSNLTKYPQVIQILRGGVSLHTCVHERNGVIVREASHI